MTARIEGSSDATNLPTAVAAARAAVAADLTDPGTDVGGAVDTIVTAALTPIRLDVDGTPYFIPDRATPPAVVGVDTDGVPYLTIGA